MTEISLFLMTRFRAVAVYCPDTEHKKSLMKSSKRCSAQGKNNQKKKQVLSREYKLYQTKTSQTDKAQEVC